MSRCLLALFCVVGLFLPNFLSAQLNLSAEGRILYRRIERAGGANNLRLSPIDLDHFLVESEGGRLVVGGLIDIDERFDESKLTALGVTVNTKAGNIWTVRVPLESFIAFSQLKGLIFFQLDQRVAPHLDTARVDSRVDSVYNGEGLPQSYTGKGVLVGVVDGGFNYTHPTFMDLSGTTCRIKRVWDQNKDGVSPSGFNYGHEYTTTEAVLAAQRDTTNGSHGTHVSGIAAGSGYDLQTDGRFRGVAPEADIVMVSNKFTWARVLDGINYVAAYAKSQNQPASINISLGGYNGGTMDGTSPIDKGIDNLTSANPGTIVSVSAGNTGGTPIHIEHDFAGDTLRTVMEIKDSLSFYHNATGQTMGWGTLQGEVGKDFSIQLKIVSNSNVTLADLGFFRAGTNHQTDTVVVLPDGQNMAIEVACYSAYPSNNRPQVRMYIDNNTKTPKHNVVWVVTAADGKVQMWNCGPIQGHNLSAKLPGGSIMPNFTAGDDKITVSEPSTSNGVLSVGAHSTKPKYTAINGQTPGWGNQVKGQYAEFTSVGPRFDGKAKPDFTGPGLLVVSSVSFFDQTLSQSEIVAQVDYEGRKYKYGAFAGTSMSCPMTTGVVALMLEKNPKLTINQAREILKSTAIQDEFTGTLPVSGDVHWGHGKLNAMAALRATPEAVGRNENGNSLTFVLFPNPTNGSAGFLPNLSGVYNLRLTNALGQVVWTNSQIVADAQTPVQLDFSALPDGFYSLSIQNGDITSAQKLVLQH